MRENVRLEHSVGRARAAQRVRAVATEAHHRRRRDLVVDMECGARGASSTWLATAASVKVYVGGQQPGMAVKAPSNVLSAEIEVAGKEVPLSAC